MVYLQEGEDITYTTDSGEDQQATITMIESLALGCVGVTRDGNDQTLIAANQIHGVALSDDGEA